MSRRLKLVLVAFAVVTSLSHFGGAESPLSGDFRIVSGLIPSPEVGSFPRAFVGSILVLEVVAAGADLRFEWSTSEGSHLEGARISYAFSTTGDASISLTVTKLSPPQQVNSSTENLRILPNFSNGDPLVTFGGILGNWGTELLLSNASSEPVVVGLDPTPFVQGCPGECFPVVFHVPAYGTTKSPAPTSLEQFSVYYFTVPTGTTPPSIRVRAINALFPSVTHPIPVARLSSLIILDPPVLSFPGAAKSAGAHCNLVLTGLLLPDLSIGPSVSGIIEVRDPGGDLLADAPFSVESGDILFIPDVAGMLGIPALDDGQIRVVRTSSDGYLWGMLATSYGDGSLAASIGATP